MPGNVANAAPATVFPAMTFRSLSKSIDWLTNVTEYPDGSTQRYSVPKGSPARPRVRFTLRARLAAGAMAALKAFYLACNGRQVPFWFYYGYETDPLFSHDPTGTETAGRYTVRFDGDWREDWALARGEVDLQLVEVT